MAIIEQTESGAQFIDREEGLRILDEHAQCYLGISGAEFVQRWKAGEYDDDPEDPDVVRVAMLLPLAE